MTQTRYKAFARLVLCIFASVFLPVTVSASSGSVCGSDQDLYRALFSRSVAALHTPEQVASYLYGVPEGLSLPEASNLDELSEAFRAFQPSEVHAEGLSRLRCVKELEEKTERSGEPVTLVLFPPLAAEFCSSLPFGDVLERQSSSAARSWRAALARKGGSAPVFDLNSLGVRRVSLAEVVQVASIDGADGRPRVTVIYMNPPRGSLESLGRPEATVSRFLPRLHEALGVLDVRGPLHFVGYSRGATLALELLSRASLAPKAYPWASRVRTVASVAGVNFGSLAADDSLRPGTPIFELLATVRWLADNLEDGTGTENPIEWSAKVARNTARWTWAVADAGRKLLLFPQPPELKREEPRLDIAPSRALSRILNSAFFEVFALDRAVSDYFGNVRRFKIFANAFFRSVDALSTRERMAWWRMHRVPERVRLVALASTMGDAWNSRDGLWPLSYNPLVTSPSTLDFSFLRLAYHHMLGHSGTPLNDGMVSLERAFFWPGLIEALSGQRLEAVNLGVFGVDHFSLGHDMAAPAREELRNPFPQEALLESLADWIALTQGGDEGR